MAMLDGRGGKGKALSTERHERHGFFLMAMLDGKAEGGVDVFYFCPAGILFLIRLYDEI